jgi:dephospho-CoA kinase
MLNNQVEIQTRLRASLSRFLFSHRCGAIQAICLMRLPANSAPPATRLKNMITIGLVGGVACGKSSVALRFRELGACVLDGDRIGHDVLRLQRVQAALVERWGDHVLFEDGSLDRSIIARMVFAGTPESNEELRFLESITHPEIGSQLAERINEMKRQGHHKIVVVDAAVMMKAGWDQLCDRIIFVDAPREIRRKRAMLRGLGEEQFLAREAAQTPIEKKRERADIIIDNSGLPQKTRQQVEKVWRSLQQIA